MNIEIAKERSKGKKGKKGKSKKLAPWDEFDMHLTENVEEIHQDNMLGLCKKARHFTYLRKLHAESKIRVNMKLADMQKLLGFEGSQKDLDLMIKTINEAQKYYRIGKFDVKRKAFIFTPQF